MKLQAVEYNGRVEFLPVRKPAELPGPKGPRAGHREGVGSIVNMDARRAL